MQRVDFEKLKVRALTRADLGSIADINSQHNKVMGIAKRSSYDEAFMRKVDLYFTEPDRYILGAFFDDKLISFVSVIRWKDFPYWTFTNAKATPFFNSNVFQPKLNGLASLISETIKKETDDQRYAYWFITSIKQNKGYKDYWRRFVPELRDFEFVSRTIPGEYRPKHRYILNLMGNHTWEEDIILRIGIRKGHEEILRPYSKFLEIDLMKLESEDNGKVLIC